MIITISAITENRVIGNGIHIPWHISEDFKLFKEFTSGHAVLMGLTTYNSMGKALPNRKNFVLSFKNIQLPDAEIFNSFEEGLKAAKEWADANGKDVFIIGGASIYRLGLDYSDKLYLSHVKGNYYGNVFFPEVNWDEWDIEEEREYEEFVFRAYNRKNKIKSFKPGNLEEIKKFDKEVYDCLIAEIERLNNSIELIASENVVSEAVLEATGSIFTNKYAEGYPNKRYYGGCANVDAVENLAKQRLLKLFNCEENYSANVQPHSGSQANMAVYFGLLNNGDKVFGMNLISGGHLTHGSPVNFSGKMFDFVHYDVNDSGFIDYDDLERNAIEHKPKMIMAGASAYPRFIDFKRLSEIAKKINAYLVVDIAHIAGLIATGNHPSPFDYADVVTSTTHKTLRGPRGGIIIFKKELEKQINSMIFPGIQGGPLEHVIAAKAVAFKEALSPLFKDYQNQVVRNAKVLADVLIKNNINLVSGGTDNHLILIDLRSLGITGKDAEKMLEDVGITTNKNTVFKDSQPPWIASGIRIGTPAITTRGFKEKECIELGEIIADVLKNKNVERNKSRVDELCKRFRLFQQ